MWKRKKFMIGLLAAVLIAVACLGGTALANGDDDNSQSDTLFSRASEILGIDQQRLEEAFSQAREELREEKLDSYLQNLIDEGIITEDQAAEYKDWLDEKPDPEEYRSQIEEWYESRPDIPGDTTIEKFRFFTRMHNVPDTDELSIPYHENNIR